MHYQRATFAIISHPDAGKTTMTESLLFQSNLLRRLGMVKSKQGKYTTSDWMELEKERGISVSTSVLSFDYHERAMHLLDTPGHNDFSEDTYRTLTAVESVLMMIDMAKGVEAQTIKLMDVCRLRDTPIATFINKLDREGLGPIAVIENIEKILSISAVPLTWPIGDGVDFRGVLEIQTNLFYPFHKNNRENPLEAIPLDQAKETFSQELLKKLEEDLEVLKELFPPFSLEEYLAGIQTPLFFGSALYNFGVNHVLEFLSKYAPPPAPKKVLINNQEKLWPCEKDSEFTGFVFKIQANMDKRHRDRMAFVRVCSGTFKKGEKIFHPRDQKELRLSNPVFFQARERLALEEALPGDIIGIYDSGKFRIGDTLSQGTQLKFLGIPSFSPELFITINLKDPLKSKQLDKGLEQLSEEGTVQLFKSPSGQKILGAVGALQFEVVKYRLEQEYNVEATYSGYALSGIRWTEFPKNKANPLLEKKLKEDFFARFSHQCLQDHKGRFVFAYQGPWDLKLAQEKFSEIIFHKTSEF